MKLEPKTQKALRKLNLKAYFIGHLRRSLLL